VVDWSFRRSWGVRFFMARRCDGRRTAGSFNVYRACRMMCCSRRRLQTLSLCRGVGGPHDVSSGRWWRGTPGVGYKGCVVILFSCKGVFVTLTVITKNINDIWTRFLKKRLNICTGTAT
jgi:hypothetical protein